MDKYEYKVRADEIKALIAEGEYAEAVKVADTIDWRRVRSVMMLCTVSDLYKINRRYQESKDILLLAYEKHPNGRLIVYSLCELSIKMGEYVQAIEYYKEFVQIAPKDTGRYILQYRLYEAQDVSLEERIAVLEEFKKRDYREKWAYELAYLYHRIGLSTKCVEECDEMFLWFGEGKYVVKALELKMLHEPLSADQKAKYDEWMQEKAAEIEEENGAETAVPEETEEEDEVSDDTIVAGAVAHSYEPVQPEPVPVSADMPTMELPEVKPVDVGQYNTINLQRELAESMRELLAQEEEQAQTAAEPAAEEAEETKEDAVTESIIAPLLQETRPLPEQSVVEEQLAAEETAQQETQPEPVQPTVQPDAEPEQPTVQPVAEPVQAEPKKQVIAFPGKAEEKPAAVKQPVNMDTDEMTEIRPAGAVTQKTQEIPPVQPAVKTEPVAVNPAPVQQPVIQPVQQEIPGARTGVLTPLNTKPSEYDKILAQEYDGQISLALPDEENIEKQITGQLSIDDIMAEWEQMKKSNEQKRMEDVRQHILAQTGSLFANFDEATKNGLLEELEKAFMAAIRKEAEKPAIKKVILPEDVELSQPKAEAVTPAPTPVPALQPVEEPEEVLTQEDTVEELEEIEEPVSVEEAISQAEAETTADGEKTGDTDTSLEELLQQTTEEAIEKAEEESGNKNRELTEEEKEIFGKFVHHKKSRQQLVNTLDNMSLASYTGNVIITGEEEDTVLALAKGLIREMQYNDSNFSGKVAKIAGAVLNKKDVAETFAKLDNGALIIEKASGMKKETIAKVAKVLDQDNKGLLLLLTDSKQKIDNMWEENASIHNNFNLRVDIEALDDEVLVEYAKQYAQEQEYSIDEFGILALHTRIADNQTSDHEVTLAEVREIVDEAIYYANKKTPKHFMDILLAKRYDEEDMIILREKDFMHY